MLSKRVVQVERALCVACGSCVKECPRKALSVFRGCWAQVEPMQCVGCGKCVRVCPANCLTLLERGAEQ